MVLSISIRGQNHPVTEKGRLIEAVPRSTKRNSRQRRRSDVGYGDQSPLSEGDYGRRDEGRDAIQPTVVDTVPLDVDPYGYEFPFGDFEREDPFTLDDLTFPEKE
jgi:hypothetical protein